MDTPQYSTRDPESRMTYWRMQLHPDDSSRSAQRAAESLSAGFIGLDFALEVGDLLTTPRENLGKQKARWR